MTHGRTAKTRVNPRSQKSTSPLTRFSKNQEKSLEARVARLEARVAAMQEEIDRASGATPAWFREAMDAAARKHHGPGKKMDDTELLLNRDNLVVWLEEHWPKIVKALLSARNPRQVAAVLRPIATAREIRPQWQSRVVGHPAKLLDFLRGEKFRIRPPKKTVVDALRSTDGERRKRAANRLPTRQIANAMAGVPKIKWRTSLDKCSERPSSYRVGYKTAEHYRAIFGVPEDKSE
jgi:hypothetical protein